jgi:hypothetical protein
MRAGLVGLLLSAAAACAPAEEPPALDLPARPAEAPTGSAIVDDIRELELHEREERILAEVAGGNVPTWLRQLEPVQLSGAAGRNGRVVTFWVTPDYLAVGSDDDFFYVPLSPRVAARVAELAGGSLPTPRMVDAVWEAAPVRVMPIRLRPDEFIWSVRYFERHNRLVQAQRTLHREAPGVFSAGHKLDVVMIAPPADGEAEVALYGWHYPDGRRVQPMLPVSLDRRPHFSMGARIVHRAIRVDDAHADLLETLRDPAFAWLFDRPR